MMDLQQFWFGVVAFFWTGFFVLEGFDFGVGALHMLVSRNLEERADALDTIAPFWDGNEVWLIVAAAAMFAAFPSWYTTMFSSLYLIIVLTIVAIILRGVSLAWLDRMTKDKWRRAWARTLVFSSALVPLLIGLALGDLLAGLPINSHGDFTGSFGDLFTAHGVLTGLTLLSLSLLQGASFLALRARGAPAIRAARLRRTLVFTSLALVIAQAISAGSQASVPDLVVAIQAVAVAAVIVTGEAVREGRNGRAFAAVTVATGAAVVSLFAALYPQVVVSSTSSKFSLTVTGAAASTYSLRVMTIVAVVILPVVLLYQGWNYYVFRSRVGGAASSEPSSNGQQPASVVPG